MILYTAKAENGGIHVVGTQADARAINRNFKQVDIPTDKAGLMAFMQDIADQETERERIIDMQSAELVRLSEGDHTPAPPPQPTNDTLARISVEEEIHNCDLPRLAVLAQCVAWRFEELSKHA